MAEVELAPVGRRQARQRHKSGKPRRLRARPTSTVKHLGGNRGVQLLKVTEAAPVRALMMIATLYALVGDDMRLLWTEKPADEAFVICSSIVFFLFAVEMLLFIVAQRGYLFPLHCKRGDRSFPGSFFFWLDLVALLSLIPEIPWMYDGALEDSNALDASRAGRASRAGARAGRIVRMVRLVRLVRVVKLYKYFAAKRAAAGGSDGGDSDSDDDDSSSTAASRGLRALRRSQRRRRRKRRLQREASMPALELGFEPESRVGAQLSDRTTRRVIVGVLIMLVCIPLLTPSDVDSSSSFALGVLHRLAVAEAGNSSDSQLAAALAAGVAQFRQQLPNAVFIQLGNRTWLQDDAVLQSLRAAELLQLAIDDQSLLARAWLDVRSASQESAMWNLLLTVLVIFLLGVGAASFTRDANRLVLRPIESMVRVVQRVARNPLKDPGGMDASIFLPGMETTMLLETIQKTAGLLRIGFGEAGAEIIGNNLDGASALDPMIPGRNCVSIFAFCDIRCFTDTTECLQEEVMLFVNRIADIVHGIAVQHYGAANKNIGDAFLLVWKLPDTATLGDGGWDERPPEEQQAAAEERVRMLADHALMAVLKILATIAVESDRILDLSPTARARLEKRMPGYKVRLGWGLHVGWAIEGSIGSKNKIDASYLSPHVNMAEKMEEHTKAFQVPLLMTDPFYQLLSEPVKDYCRILDYMSLHGHPAPLRLYTYDCDLTAPLPPRRAKRRTSSSSSSSAMLALRSGTLLSSARSPVRKAGKPKPGSAAASTAGEAERKEKDAPAVTGPPVRGRSSDDIEAAAPSSSPSPFSPAPKSPRRGRPQLRVVTDAPLEPMSLSPPAAAPATPARMKSMVSSPAIYRSPTLRRLHSTRSGGWRPGRQAVHPSAASSTSISAFSPRSLMSPSSPLSPLTPRSPASPSASSSHFFSPFDSLAMWQHDEDLVMLRRNSTPRFLRLWRRGFAAYTKGSWPEASGLIAEAAALQPSGVDGPAHRLLSFMAGYGGIAPKEWAGYRTLDMGE